MLILLQEVSKQNVEQPQLRHHIFKERNHQLRCGRVFAGKVQREGNTQRDHRHPEILPARNQALGVFTHHFAIVINKANDAVTYQHHQYAPDVRIGWVSPQQYGDHNRRQDHNPAHGRRTALAERSGFVRREYAGMEQASARTLPAADLGGLQSASVVAEL